MRKKRRKLKSGGSFKDINFSSFFKEREKKQKKIEESRQKFIEETFSKGKCYKVRYTNIPDMYCIVFGENRSKATYEGFKYFRDKLHPQFIHDDTQLYKSRLIRLPIFDKYGIEGKIPIPELMKELDMSFPCSVCKKEEFTYRDYDKKRCYIIEGEGDADTFVKGLILCHSCYRKYYT